MEKMTDMGYGKTDKQLATAFGISVSDVKRIKSEIAKEISRPKFTSKPKTKNLPKEVTGKRKPLKGIIGKNKPSKKPMSYEDALKKYNNDVTKIPGNSRGKRVQ